MVLAFLLDSAGFGEWFVLLAVVLIVVGPKRLPETARKLGSFYSKFRRAAENFKRELLDMDRSVTNFIEETEKSAEDAFKVEGDESESTPGDYDGISSYGDDDGVSYGDDDDDTRGEDENETPGESDMEAPGESDMETPGEEPLPKTED